MHPLVAEFAAELDSPFEFARLLDAIPDACCYAKNLRSQFVMANQAELRLLGIGGLDAVIGKRDHDFFEKNIADLYVREDQLVFGGQPVLNKRWMVPDDQGRMHWYASSKMPLRNRHGQTVGLCGLLRSLQAAGDEIKPYHDLAEVIQHINKHYPQRIRIGDLAGMLDLSASQFNRKFKAFSGMSPAAYIIRVRINAACRQLQDSERTVTAIALAVGFYDQSCFTHQFQKIIGRSPTQFRQNPTAR